MLKVQVSNKVKIYANSVTRIIQLLIEANTTSPHCIKMKLLKFLKWIVQDKCPPRRYLAIFGNIFGQLVTTKRGCQHLVDRDQERVQFCLQSGANDACTKLSINPFLESSGECTVWTTLKQIFNFIKYPSKTSLCKSNSDRTKCYCDQRYPSQCLLVNFDEMMPCKVCVHEDRNHAHLISYCAFTDNDFKGIKCLLSAFCIPGY